jgi:molybdopterin molybdotransferase
VRQVTLAEALEAVARIAPDPGREEVPLEAAAGRVLAGPVPAAADVPGYDGSAMDGWAVRARDTPGRLRVAGESAAGAPWDGRLGEGEALRVSTGAALPAGADAVVRQEDARPVGGAVEVPRTAPGHDVRARGEVIEAGGELLPAGAVVGPHAVGALGAAGVVSVPVRRAPRVAILATGAELVPLGAPLRPGAVYDSSRIGLMAQIRAAGGEVAAAETVGDDAAATLGALGRLLALEPDLLVTTGGIGFGPHDHVAAALEAAGLRPVLRGLRVVPCRPTGLFAGPGGPALALPGNPVSAAVAFHLLGRPLLGRPEGWERRAPLDAPYPRHADRAEAVRCVEREGRLVALPQQDSHAVAPLARATALALVGPGEGPTPPGAVVPYSPLA